MKETGSLPLFPRVKKLLLLLPLFAALVNPANAAEDPFLNLGNLVARRRQIIREVGGEPVPAGVILKEELAAAPLKILSRAEWGAEESWRFAEEPAEDFLKNPPAGVTRTELFENGRPLAWPLQFANPKAIVVHHTATKNGAEPFAAVREIFRFHAKEKGWGDIGYHFLIGPAGRIFEGRKGGETVVAGHAAGWNVGTIGISLLGNFSKTSPTAAALSSLEKLLSFLAKKHRLDLRGETLLKGKKKPVLLGHRDLNATDCPGEKLFREVVRLRGGQVLTKEKPAAAPITKHQQPAASSSSPFSFEILSGGEEIRGAPGEELEIKLLLKNTGAESWDSLELRTRQEWRTPAREFLTPGNR